MHPQAYAVTQNIKISKQNYLKFMSKFNSVFG